MVVGWKHCRSYCSIAESLTEPVRRTKPSRDRGMYTLQSYQHWFPGFSFGVPSKVQSLWYIFLSSGSIKRETVNVADSILFAI